MFVFAAMLEYTYVNNKESQPQNYENLSDTNCMTWKYFTRRSRLIRQEIICRLRKYEQSLDETNSLEDRGFLCPGSRVPKDNKNQETTPDI